MPSGFGSDEAAPRDEFQDDGRGAGLDQEQGDEARPSARPASTSPQRVASSSRERRPAGTVAVSAPPMRMPVTGTSAMP